MIFGSGCGSHNLSVEEAFRLEVDGYDDYLFGFRSLESISKIKINVWQNLNYINENLNRSYYTTSEIIQEGYEDYTIYYGDRFFYYPHVLRSKSYYKAKRNNTFNRIESFEIKIAKTFIVRHYEISYEDRFTIQQSTESLEEKRSRYHAMEVEENNLVSEHQQCLWEREAIINDLIMKKEVKYFVYSLVDLQ
jgi:hypothetical protein